MLPEDEYVIETCRSILSVLMLILDFWNNIYIYMHVLVCVIEWTGYNSAVSKVKAVEAFILS